MLPVIWLKTLEVSLDKLTSSIYGLTKNSELMHIVHECYFPNAVKYFKTLTAYDSVAAKINSKHTPLSEDDALRQTIEVANGTASLSFRIFKDDENSTIWVGTTFHDPDLITPEFVAILKNELSLDSSKESMVGGIAVAEKLKLDHRHAIDIKVNLGVSFTLNQLNSATSRMNEEQLIEFNKTVLDNVVLLLTMLNHVSRDTIDINNIKETINAT